MDRIEFYPDDRGDRVNFESPGSFAIVWVAFPYDRPGRLNISFETTGTIGTIRTIRTIIWKPGLNVLKVTSKMLHNESKRKKQTVPAAQKKIELKHPDLSLEWKDIYSLPFTVTHDTKTREFQYKLLNNIVFTNDKLFRFKMIDSPLCAFVKQKSSPLRIYSFIVT